MKKLSLKLGWLYPRFMSTYGDRGNVLILQRRCELREIDLEILEIDDTVSPNAIKDLDLIFGGGAQDMEQKLVMQDLRGDKKKYLLEKIEKDMPAVFVCGAPQLMGVSYEPARGEVIEGVGIFDMRTKHPGPSAERLIGNIVAKINTENLPGYDPKTKGQGHIVGFENHGGRTTLGPNAKALAKVIKGFGNNGEDATEGVVYKNAVGTYLHGPLFAKNPHMADWFVQKALEVKYNVKTLLEDLDDSLEEKAQTTIARKLGVEL